MNDKKEFHLGDILSITHDVLVSPRGMDGVYELMKYLYNKPMFTHQVLTLHEEIKKELIRQHSWLTLNDVDEDIYILKERIKKIETTHSEKDFGISPLLEMKKDAVFDWLAKCCKKYGKMHFISPMPNAEIHDPIKDAEALVGKDNVIVVDVEEDEKNKIRIFNLRKL